MLFNFGHPYKNFFENKYVKKINLFAFVKSLLLYLRQV